MTETIQILDKNFSKSIDSQEIQSRIGQIADEINSQWKGKDLVFVAVLNGAFMFATDIIRRIELPCRVSFLKLASYQGSTSTGVIKQLVGINENLQNKTVIILEDIVDTGNTLDLVTQQLKSFYPAEIKIITLLYKPEACKYNFNLDFVGFSIPNDFIVGYGLDYNGLGRNLENIYTEIKNY
ncbi:MAG: hypoxanthine phosphoribosyltransferase [Bacteroidales bacterium]|nr:hypoxanthine phosphoribosyltransferase [Bacteroidales bacterium]